LVGDLGIVPKKTTYRTFEILGGFVTFPALRKNSPKRQPKTTTTSGYGHLEGGALLPRV